MSNKRTATITYLDHAIEKLEIAKARLEKEYSFCEETALHFISDAEGALRTCTSHLKTSIDERLKKADEGPTEGGAA